MECIILAGGLGTRLQHIVSDVPKCLAPINGKPFLEYVLNYLEQQFCDHVILSLGYKHEMVLDWLKSKAFTFKVSWTIEKEPLGTGGGIKNAIRKCKEPNCFIINGDTFFPVSLRELEAQKTSQSKAVLALKSMENFDRYGTVLVDNDGLVASFEEKQKMESGIINGGVYLLQNVVDFYNNSPDKFSFEKDFLEKEAGMKTLKALVFEDYFIDIGVEEDYNRAQTEMIK